MTVATSRPRERAIPWHPALFGVAIVLTVWLDSAVSPYAVTRSFAVAAVFAATLTALGSVALRSVQLGGLASTLVIWLLWSKELVHVGATALERLGPVAILWFIGIGIVLGLLARLVLKRARHLTLDSVTVILNRAGGLLVVATLLLGVVGGTLPALARDLPQGVTLEEWVHDGEPASVTERPDIYAILLDGYPRADVLEYAFDFDNAAFEEALAERGFEVSTLAHSDYLWTHVSVPSALNMAYIEQIPTLADVVAERVPQQPRLRHSITDNAVFDFVHEHGYDTIAVASGFEEVTARQADVLVDGGQMTEFEVSLLASTFLGDFLAFVSPDLASSQHRERILNNLGALGEIAATRNRPPALVYAHIPAPHQPVVFGPEGAPLVVPIAEDFYADSPVERAEDPDEFRERYRAHLPFLNARILAAIDEILVQSSEAPVIVLFADHGSASRTDWNATDPARTDPTILLERTGILFAALTPGQTDLYPDEVSPVDLFRLLFDSYFGTEYGRAVRPGGGEIEPVDPAVLETRDQ